MAVWERDVRGVKEGAEGIDALSYLCTWSEKRSAPSLACSSRAFRAPRADYVKGLGGKGLVWTRSVVVESNERRNKKQRQCVEKPRGLGSREDPAQLPSSQIRFDPVSGGAKKKENLSKPVSDLANRIFCTFINSKGLKVLPLSVNKVRRPARRRRGRIVAKHIQFMFFWDLQVPVDGCASVDVLLIILGIFPGTQPTLRSNLHTSPAPATPPTPSLRTRGVMKFDRLHHEGLKD